MQRYKEENSAICVHRWASVVAVITRTWYQPHKTAPFAGGMGFSTKSKNPYPPFQSGWRHAASEQAVAYLRENLEVKRFAALQSGGWGVANLGKCCLWCFFAATLQKSITKRGLGLRPKGNWVVVSSACHQRLPTTRSSGEAWGRIPGVARSDWKGKYGYFETYVKFGFRDCLHAARFCGSICH
jgi:hypothetical protein